MIALNKATNLWKELKKIVPKMSQNHYLCVINNENQDVTARNA